MLTDLRMQLQIRRRAQLVKLRIKRRLEKVSVKSITIIMGIEVQLNNIEENQENHIILMIDIVEPEEAEKCKKVAMARVTGVLTNQFTKRKVTLIQRFNLRQKI